MKKKMKLLDRIFMSGIWLSPLVLCGLYKYVSMTRPYVPVSSYPWPVMILVSLLPSLYVYSGNLISVAAGKTEYGPEDIMIDRPHVHHSASKMRAMYPDVDPQLLYKEPEGIVLGKKIGKKKTEYICKPLDDNGGNHCLVLGGSGSGKSSTVILDSLIANPDARVFCIDIKGELSAKSRKRDDPKTIIVNPEDRNTWGWDPLYELVGTPSEQQILETMHGIACSLIPLSAEDREPFWKINARNLLTGLLVGYYKNGIKDFIGLVDVILETPIKDSIATLLERARSGSVERKYLAAYSDLADDTLTGIVTEIFEHLTIFADQDIRFMFSVNRRRANPGMILELGSSLFICLLEHHLEAYYDILQLIINETLSLLERRDEAETEPVIFIVDEMARIMSHSRIERLLDAIKTLRSRSVYLMMVSQSLESLETAYSKPQIMDLVSNCAYIVCLDVKSPETAKMICSMAGTYKEKEQSWNGSGPKGHITTSYKDRDVLEPSDLSKLVLQGEVVLITPYGYFRASKAPYYSDTWFKPKAEKIRKYNAEIQKLKGMRSQDKIVDKT